VKAEVGVGLFEVFALDVDVAAREVNGTPAGEGLREGDAETRRIDGVERVGGGVGSDAALVEEDLVLAAAAREPLEDRLAEG
jgi:hypothetical protein